MSAAPIWAFHGVLQPTHGRGTFSQLLGVGRAMSKPAGLLCLQSWLVPAPLTPGCLTKIAAMERGLLTFFFSFSFSFFFLPVLKLPQTSSEGSGISSYRCGIEALVAKYIRHGSWYCCAISINLRKPLRDTIQERLRPHPSLQPQSRVLLSGRRA